MTAAAEKLDAFDDDVDEEVCNFLRWDDRYLSNKGMQKAAVFPDPVLAMTTVSFPERMTGRDFLWTGVGVCW